MIAFWVSPFFVFLTSLLLEQIIIDEFVSPCSNLVKEFMLGKLI